MNDNLIHVINNTINFPWIYLINSNTLSFFITQIIEGLKVLFEHNIVHRDIKGENIIIAYLFKLKISDFGIAKKQKVILKELCIEAHYLMILIIKINNTSGLTIV